MSWEVFTDKHYKCFGSKFDVAHVHAGMELVKVWLLITKKEQADGQKTDYKGQLVAKGFQEISA